MEYNDELMSYLGGPPSSALNVPLDLGFDHFGLPSAPGDDPRRSPTVARSEDPPSSEEDGRTECRDYALGCFPDMCPEYLEKVAAEHQWVTEDLIYYLLDEQEKGHTYPKRSRPLKRKLPDPEEGAAEEARKKFVAEDPRRAGKGQHYFKSYIKAAKSLLKGSFPQLYVLDIEKLLKENHYSVYPTYLALDKACSSGDPKFRFKSKKANSGSSPPDTAGDGADEAENDAWKAFCAARDLCQSVAAKEKAEAENWQRAKDEGNIVDCGCCYSEFPLNKMVHCNGDVAHLFCRDCARRLAEDAVGYQKYQLTCMSTDGCEATFSKDQRDLFLDENLVAALDKIEQETVLRMAAIENLETCPFCSYAAEYPPVEENKEFRCENLECGMVSCRRCRQETHIPKTCEEHARESGHSARRLIEEAMSAALIRTCNKCGTPFIKENGCNKMTCTRAGCKNVQCYVCSKSCDYSHFDDASRGGKKGNCPLFDSVEQRHEAEVRAAEEKARKQVAEENPDVDVEMFKIHFSEKVKKDDERRKTANPGPAPMPYHRVPRPGARHRALQYNSRISMCRRRQKVCHSCMKRSWINQRSLVSERNLLSQRKRSLPSKHDIPARLKEAMDAQWRQLQAQRQHLQQLRMQVEQQRYLQAEQHVGPPLPPGQAVAVNRLPGARLVADPEQNHLPAPFYPAVRDYDLQGLNPQIPRVNQVQPQILPVQGAVDELLPIPEPSGINGLRRYPSVNILPAEAMMQGPGPAVPRPASPLPNPRPAGGLE
ncbi:Protein ariadne-1 [Madurella mycetomatis]|uniref:Protein ariadne-1 n=1 Tax=Madurella mycetomatis TaxID=100816 RepID=A0A175W0V8_9PEZI|nr:Protein ariadne-1 [Madurella mycetomatis]